MRHNAIVPYLLIMVFGIGLIFALSFMGLNQGTEKAGKEENKGNETVATAPEDFYKQNCSSCHGDQYQGGVGPALKGVGSRLSEDEIKDVLKNGRGQMPAGLVPDNQLDAMAKWLMSLK
ncbi:MAG: cytochrome c [Caldibacillus debilis]|jgi:cytochrome c550|uniref:Cytochrome c, mono-and diheme variant n=2 Tax=Caldibacillus debilis TaxID=301148 RepID=A0A420VE62_9BACI|nr:cytochrome c [Caldibacillus debilis]MBO2482499.1 cytochrome c [Bacillaceae bacterium]MBY6272672.1 cytochrome C [Bacillaceae bacterium]OUM89800.1 MAG: cytochrome C [Caldibacillus debilis]REJ14055.1 MAG: cytochrome c [Caldibacillus debilis]REJ26129.1 MAG: cytochrome c [Caldibacillus debilis]